MTPEPDPEIPLLDELHLQMLVGPPARADLATLREVLALFAQENAQPMADLAAAVAQADGPRIARLAHFVAGGASNLGMRRLYQYCRAMEEGLRSGAVLPEETEGFHERLQVLLEETQAALAKLFPGFTAGD